MMSDAFDVEAILEERAGAAIENGNARREEYKKESSKRDSESPVRERSADRRERKERRRSRSRDRRRDSRDRHTRRRRHSPSDSRDRRSDRDKDRRSRRDRDSRDRSSDRRDRSSDRSDRNKEKKADMKADVETKKEPETAAEKEAARRQREIDDLTKDQRTLFVGQLVKKVTERNLEDFFSQIGKVRSIIMLRDKYTNAHKGFAYVEMGELETIPNCLLFNNVVPDFQAFPILVKSSEAEKNFLAKKDSSISSGAMLSSAGNPLGGGGDSRIYVGNIHLSIDELSLRSVLEQFGPIESIKLQRDAAGISKGFAFVKYISADSAKVAMAALPSIELVGRFLKVGPVLDSRGMSSVTGVDPLNVVGNLTDQSSSWKLDSDDGNSGLPLDSTKRMQLMAKLAESAGMSVPIAAPYGGVNTVGTAGSVLAPVPVAVSVPGQPPKAATAAPIGGLPSTYFVIRNMFDPRQETAPHWDDDIKEDVVDQCSNFGRVESCHVDTKDPSGCVFVRMVTQDAAMKAANNLNGRFFAGRTISVSFLDEKAFNSAVGR